MPVPSMFCERFTAGDFQRVLRRLCILEVVRSEVEWTEMDIRNPDAASC